MGFLGGIGGGVVFPILPALGERMGLSALLIGLVLAANRITRLGINPVTGALTDRFGGREVIAAGLFLEGLGTLGYIAALHFGTPAAWFLVGRVVWGVGSSLLFVGAVAAVLTLTASGNRGRLVARARSAISLGVPAGLVVGGVVSDLVSADAAFLVAALLSVAAGIAALYGIPRRAPAPAAPAPRNGGLRQWLDVIAQGRLLGIWIYSALTFFGMQGVLLATLVVLVQRRGLYLFSLGAEGSAGLLMAFLMLAYSATSVLVGRRIDREGRRTRLLVPTVLALAFGFALLAFARSLAALLPALFVIGIGAGAVTIALLALMGDFVSRKHHGRATAVYQVAADVGGALGALLGLVLGTRFGFEASDAAIAVLFLLMLPLAGSLIAAERAHRNRRGTIPPTG